MVPFPVQVDPRLRAAWYKLQQLILDGAGSAGIGNMLFVSKDATGSGTRNSLVDPFPTIGAALASAQTGDVIYVGPGTYVENVVLRDDIQNYAIVGPSFGSASIDPATGSAVSLQATTDVGSFVLMGMRLVSNEFGVAALDVGQAAVDGEDPFPNGTLFCKDVVFENTVSTQCVSLNAISDANMWDCLLDTDGGPGAPLLLQNVGSFRGVNLQVEAGVNEVAYDETIVQPDSGPQPCRFEGCRFVDGCNVSGLGNADFQSCYVGGLGLSVYDRDLGVFGTHRGQATAHDSYLGFTAVDAEYTLGSDYDSAADLSGCRFERFESSIVVGGSPISVNLQSSIHAPGEAIIAGENCRLDLRAASFAQADLSALGAGATRGQVMRDRIRVTGIAVAAAPGNTQAIDPPLPTGYTSYTVVYEVDAPPGATWGIVTSAKANDTFTPGGQVDGAPAEITPVQAVVLTEG